jgi:hypothetical protein
MIHSENMAGKGARMIIENTGPAKYRRLSDLPRDYGQPYHCGTPFHPESLFPLILGEVRESPGTIAGKIHCPL